jgi:chromosomal replication initiator protein
VQVAISDPASRIAQRIEDKIGPRRFRVWFKDATRLDVTDHCVRIDVPNSFVGTWIENHFADHIVTAAREILGGQVQIGFAVDPGLAGKVRQPQLNRQAESVRQATQQPTPASAVRLKAETPTRFLRGRLDDFVVGPSSQMAYQAALEIVERPAGIYNPLFVHGGCGVGKTHLLQGICNAFAERRPDVRWLYVSGEEFTNDYIHAIRTAQLDRFRARYRDLDVLVIDDVHFLANKKATQEEFLHTFNAIDAGSKQIALASDAHPKLIGQFSESLVSRFMAGMVVCIEPPAFGTRCQILERRAVKLNRIIPQEVIEYIAQNVTSSVRELEGALLKLIAFNSVAQLPLTVATAQKALADYLSRTRPLVTISDLENAVATFFGMSPADLHSTRKTQHVALARNIAMHLARKHTTLSYPQIGRYMGNKNHATVILACRRIGRILAEDGVVRWPTPTCRKSMRLCEVLEQLEAQIRA